MKVLTRSILASSIAFALLSGCGGSDSVATAVEDKLNDLDVATTKTVSVIDGYLENADVYIDRNMNGIADASEKLAAKTDAKGEIEITLLDAKFDLIAQINGDSTKDSDGTGTTGRSYQMIAKAGLDFITPFTTIAKVQNKTMADVAADMNIDEAVISGDYVAQKQVSEKSEDAKKAHAYARNLTTTLTQLIATNDDASVARFLETIKAEIDSAITNNVDLDTIFANVVELEDILVGGETFYSVALNEDTNSRESITTFTYNEDATYDVSNNNSEYSGSYAVDGNVATYDGEAFGDDIVYVSHNNYISVTATGILDVYSKTKEQLPVSPTMFVGTTWYQLFDDGGSTNYSTTPCFMKVEFTTASEMKYIESGNCEISDSHSGEGTEYPYHWSMTDNTIAIYDDEEGSTGGELNFNVISKSELLLVIEDTDTNEFSVFIKNKPLALNIFTTWKANITAIH
ncbi:MAG: hypothetical protein ACI9T7_001607 [Oleiphilaceae bacterium]|jgi:hypothetical protein